MRPIPKACLYREGEVNTGFKSVDANLVGKPSIKKMFDYFNTLLFEGRLPKIPVLIGEIEGSNGTAGFFVPKYHYEWIDTSKGEFLDPSYWHPINRLESNPSKVLMASFDYSDSYIKGEHDPVPRPYIWVNITIGDFWYTADTLVHEMVHLYQYATNNFERHIREGHGPFFVATCKRINRKMGFKFLDIDYLDGRYGPLKDAYK